MMDENPAPGILSEADAMDVIRKNRESDTQKDNDQAAPDAEVEEEAEPIEPEEVEVDEVEAESEAANDDEDEATAEGDTDEEIDADELERGYLRQQDYSRKTMALAEKERQVTAQLQQGEAQVQQKLAELDRALQMFTVPTEQEPNWLELSEKLEPKAFQRKQAEWAQKQSQRQTAAQLQEQMTAAQTAQKVQAEEAILMEKLPEWRDPSIQTRDLEAIVRVGADFGFTIEDIGNIVDHRQILALHRLAKAASVKSVADAKRVKTKPRIKSAAAPVKVDNQEKALRDRAARLKETGSVEDAMALIKAQRAKRAKA